MKTARITNPSRTKVVPRKIITNGFRINLVTVSNFVGINIIEVEDAVGINAINLFAQTISSHDGGGGEPLLSILK